MAGDRRARDDAAALADVHRLQTSPGQAGEPTGEAAREGTRSRWSGWTHILRGIFTFWLCRHRADLVKRLVRKAAQAQLPDEVDVDVHFKPPYKPWDQRFCVVPDGDLFGALRRGGPRS